MKRNNSAILGGVAILIIGLLAGCNPAPKYAKPPAQAPSAYKEAVPQEYKEGNGWKVAEPGDDKIRGKWWEMYNDPQLNALEEQVKVSNQSIASAEANFRVSRSLILSGRAALFPVVTASAQYTNSRFSQTSRGATVIGAGGAANQAATTTSTTATGTSSAGGVAGSGSSTAVGGNASTGVLNNYSLPVDVSYTIDLWHKLRNAVAVSTYQAQASAADVATALLSTQAELAQDYFQIRALDAERAILRDTVTNYQQSLNLTTIRFKGGIASEEDVSQAQTQLDTAIAQETDLGVARAQYEHAIAVLIGKPPANFELGIAPFKPNPPAVPVALPSELLERRPDIAAAERQVAAANAQIGVARAAYYPSLTFSASGGFESSSFTQWFDWPSRFWSLGPTLAQTIFDAGLRRAANQQAQAAYEGTVANYRQAVLTAFQAVEDNLSTLRILSEEVVEQHTAVNSANHYLDLSMTRYRGGVDDYLTVITAQNTLLSNRQAELQVQLRQMTASVSLIMALGGGWEASQLPNVRQLTAKQSSNSSGNSQASAEPKGVSAPNPPPLGPSTAVPGAPNNPPGTPVPTTPVGTKPPSE
jgi:NodT family efflux transporter outer membrane factor (OMF) lipoprotein